MVTYSPIEDNSWGLAKELGIEPSDLPEFEALYDSAYYRTLDEALLVACGSVVESIARKLSGKVINGTKAGQWVRHMESFIYT